MKNGKWMSVAATGMAVFLLSVSSSGYSDAASVDVIVSQLSCDKLHVLENGKMNAVQHAYALKCDEAEADRAWEQVYGSAGGGVLGGVVYE
ncbi:hypothetical protein [Neisseria weaveri]|uniref:Putative secreted protein n=1 Tax=Neisseria weaveri TaxID=28091 RepID=A0A448VPM9_9NEIS|nr:hypothetical protein [Neisseria weaveri]EGV36989.1 hypothetical protein l13_05190 [Neisseria weaveri ATCC 51223]EGV38120.1 hypothetical protein l11_06920 [Neisseria weaveri LMG 5135]SAY50357.1 putative secreted protein [Neisseria weaveri]VEJ51765.1 putative secreted protein [Neisseria weaveri]